MTKGNPEDATNQGVTRGEFNEATRRIDYLFTGVTIVLVIGFVTLLIAVISPIIDAWRFRTSTYQNLVNVVYEQNNKIDSLSTYIHQKLK